MAVEIYPYRIPKYTMALATYTQAKNMVVEHAIRTMMKKNMGTYGVKIEKYSKTAGRYEPFLDVKGYRMGNGDVAVVSERFRIRMSEKKALEFLMEH